MTTPNPAQRARTTPAVAAVQLLAPYLDGPDRVTLTINVGTSRRPVYEQLTGVVTGIATRIIGPGRVGLDVVFLEDGAPTRLTFRASRVIRAERPAADPERP